MTSQIFTSEKYEAYSINLQKSALINKDYEIKNKNRTGKLLQRRS